MKFNTPMPVQLKVIKSKRACSHGHGLGCYTGTKMNIFWFLSGKDWHPAFTKPTIRVSRHAGHEIHETCHSVTFYLWYWQEVHEFHETCHSITFLYNLMFIYRMPKMRCWCLKKQCCDILLVKTVHHSVPWSTTVYHGVQQCTTMYHDAPQCTTM